MQFDFFMKAWLANALSESERQNIVDGFVMLTIAIANKQPEILRGTSLVFSGLYLYAIQNERKIKDVIALANGFLSEQVDFTVTVELRELVGQFWADIQYKRVEHLIEKINSKNSLAESIDHNEYSSSLSDARASRLYENKSEKLNVEFSVDTLPFPLEVLDPRIVRIPVGKSNELHKHAHETIFVFMQGRGSVKIDELSIRVHAGSFIFIPRWCMHQSINEGKTEMILLAVADYGLTGKSFLGNYLKSARLKRDIEQQPN